MGNLRHYDDPSKHFTQIYNGIFHDKSLSLKAKGAYCQIRSLSENWNFSLKGFASLSKDGRESTENAIHELENAGYLLRGQEIDRNNRGRFGSGVWITLSTPEQYYDAVNELKSKGIMVTSKAPITENPSVGESVSAFPANRESCTINNQADKAISFNKNENQSIEENGPQPEIHLLDSEDEKAFDQLCSLSLKPLKNNSERLVAKRCFAETLGKGYSTTQIIDAYQEYVEAYKSTNNTPKYAKRLPDWLQKADGFHYFVKGSRHKTRGVKLNASEQRRLDLQNALQDSDPDFAMLLQKEAELHDNFLVVSLSGFHNADAYEDAWKAAVTKREKYLDDHLEAATIALNQKMHVS